MPDTICGKCTAPVEAAAAREYVGRTLCEDCYLDALTPAKACDPWAVYTARSLKDPEGKHFLTPRQQRLSDLVQERGELSFPEAAQALGLTEEELRREFATLRHMELLRACKKDRQILITRF